MPQGLLDLLTIITQILGVILAAVGFLIAILAGLEYTKNHEPK